MLCCALRAHLSREASAARAPGAGGSGCVVAFAHPAGMQSCQDLSPNLQRERFAKLCALHSAAAARSCHTPSLQVCTACLIVAALHPCRTPSLTGRMQAGAGAAEGTTTWAGTAHWSCWHSILIAVLCSAARAWGPCAPAVHARFAQGLLCSLQQAHWCTQGHRHGQQHVGWGHSHGLLPALHDLEAAESLMFLPEGAADHGSNHRTGLGDDSPPASPMPEIAARPAHNELPYATSTLMGPRQGQQNAASAGIRNPF